MKQEEILLRIQPIFQKVFKKPELVVQHDDQPSSIESWDSLHHVLLIDHIEKEFDIEFDIDDVLNFNTVGDICERIANKIA